jgi:hypothetical protein
VNASGGSITANELNERLDALDSTSKTSPGCMKTGGLRAAPTPPGVPVMITSPGSRLIATLIISTSAETLKMSWSVLASCMTRPFKRP